MAPAMPLGRPSVYSDALLSRHPGRGSLLSAGSRPQKGHQARLLNTCQNILCVLVGKEHSGEGWRPSCQPDAHRGRRKHPTSPEQGKPLMGRRASACCPGGRAVLKVSTSGLCTTGPLKSCVNYSSQCPVYLPVKQTMCFLFMYKKFFQNTWFHKCTTSTKKSRFKQVSRKANL